MTEITAQLDLLNGFANHFAEMAKAARDRGTCGLSAPRDELKRLEETLAAASQIKNVGC